MWHFLGKTMAKERITVKLPYSFQYSCIFYITFQRVSTVTSASFKFRAAYISEVTNKKVWLVIIFMKSFYIP
jgi:hypothetical protein